MNKLFLGGLVSVLMLGGCSAKYSCVSGDTGAHCRPLTQVARANEGEINDYRIARGGQSKGRDNVRKGSWSFNFAGGSESEKEAKTVVSTPVAISRPEEAQADIGPIKGPVVGVDQQTTMTGLRSDVKTPKTTILSRVETGDPILTKPKVAAIYYTPYKDMQGDLNLGGYIYVKITESEWVLTK